MSAILYCDNDNIQYKDSAEYIAKLLPNTDQITCYKIFGGSSDFIKLDDSVRPRHKYIICPKPITKRGNSSDIHLAIEVMKDLAKSPIVNTSLFIICSNDTDFVPLCQELRENHRQVWLIIDSKNTQGVQNEHLSKIYNRVFDINVVRKKEEELQRIAKEKEFKDLINTNIGNLYLKLDTPQISFPTIIEEFTKNDLDWRSKGMKFKAFLQKYLFETKYKIVGECVSRK
jgi:uncharacterized LabA/DUF88 family protein